MAANDVIKLAENRSAFTCQNNIDKQNYLLSEHSGTIP